MRSPGNQLPGACCEEKEPAHPHGLGRAPEGNGCPITGMGTGRFFKKVYVDLSFGSHSQAFHSNGALVHE